MTQKSSLCPNVQFAREDQWRRKCDVIPNASKNTKPVVFAFAKNFKVIPLPQCINFLEKLSFIKITHFQFSEILQIELFVSRK